MIGRFLGTEVPAAGISLGFERLVDLVTTSSESATDAVALVYESVEPSLLASLKSALVGQGLRVRLEKKPKKLAGLLDTLAASGFGRFALVTPSTTSVDDLEFRDLSS